MKRSFILLFVLAVCATASWADAPGDDAKAIKEAVANYVEGWFDSDAGRMSKSLHPNLSKGTVKSVPKASTEYLDLMSSEALTAYAANNQEWVKGKKTRSMKIIYQDERIAVVHALSDDFYDICGLAKINGEWKIVHVLWARNPAEE